MLKINPDKPYLPSNTRVYAIGDIHGGLHLLTKMMEEIFEQECKLPEKEIVYLVFLGDYIDRGMHSKQVIDYLLTEIPLKFSSVFIKGNHEDMLIKILAEEEWEYLKAFNNWLFSGGKNTLESYGVSASDENVRAIFLKALPAEHLLFLQNLQLKFDLGAYFFCHAGVYPGIALEQQLPFDLMWIRNLFLNSRDDHGKIIVHGHTPSEPLHHGNRIALDHGSVTKGKLASVRLEEDGSHDILIVSHLEMWRNG